MCFKNTICIAYQNGTLFFTGFVLVKCMETPSSSSEQKLSLCFVQSWYKRWVGDWHLGFLHFHISCWHINRYFLKAPCISVETLVPLEWEGGYLIWLSYGKHRESQLSCSPIQRMKAWYFVIPEKNRSNQGFAKIALRLKKCCRKAIYTSIIWEWVWSCWCFVIHSLHSNCLV